MQRSHLRLVPSEPDTGDPTIDAVLGTLAECLGFLDDRYFLGQIDQVDRPEGRYFEATLTEVAEWIAGGRYDGAQPLNAPEVLSQLAFFEQAGWGLYVRLPGDAICRVAASSEA